MTTTVLLDLDNTLLGNDMNNFLPPYFAAVHKHLQQFIDGKDLPKLMMASVQVMLANQDPTVTNMTAFMADFSQRLGHPIEVIQTAINATHALAAQTNLKVKVEVSPDLPTIKCDKDRLVQVVTNLLSNAIKFTSEGGTIQVKAQTLNGSKSKKTPDMVMVSVSDTGVGIAPKDYKSVFEKFKQVGDTLTDKPKGTGLGLPICKEIIEHYGGKIWVESELGKGSTFFFTLPAVPAAEAEAPEVE